MTSLAALLSSWREWKEGEREKEREREGGGGRGAEEERGRESSTRESIEQHRH